MVLLAGCRKTPRGQRAERSPRPAVAEVAVVDAAAPPAFTRLRLIHLPCLMRQCGVFSFTVHGDGRLQFDADPRGSGIGVSEGMATARELQGLVDALAEAPPPTPDPGPGREVPDCGKGSLLIERAGGREELEYDLCNVPRRALGIERVLAAARHGRSWRAFFPSP